MELPMMTSKTVGFAGLGLALFAVPAFGHHSHAMFDDQKTMVLEGTVEEFEWTNPHSWLQVNVVNEAGETVEWSLEMGSPANLSRDGWRPRTLVSGDAVTVTIHPLKDGNPGGALVAVKLPDGSTMGDDEYTN
jgi:hypothetical protein